jgi:hypothetical protein
VRAPVLVVVAYIGTCLSIRFCVLVGGVPMIALARGCRLYGVLSGLVKKILG